MYNRNKYLSNIFFNVFWKKTFCLLLAIGLFSTSHVYGQGKLKTYWNRLFNDTADVASPKFLIYPTVAYSPETSWELGLSSLYVYYANRDTSNRLSEIYGFTFYTLNKQYGLLLDHALYSDQNKWFFLGKLRFQSFPLLYYGIGPDTPSEYIARVDANQLQFKERVLRKVYGNFFTGLELDYQRLSSVNFVTPDEKPIEKPLGGEGSSNLGIGAGLIYDTRHNVLNVRDGLFSEIALLRYAKALGSSSSFTTIISDNRFYKSVNNRDVIAAQVFGQFNSGDTPFNQLALLGGETIMRGYYLGRYRDNNQLATQVEYRFLPIPLGFTKRLGAAVFGSAGTVFNNFSTLAAKDVVFAGGGGIRFLLFPKRDIFTRFDVAFTREGSGFYLFIGEAF